MTAVEVVISGLSARAESISSKLASSAIERGNVVIRSQLSPEYPLNDHLVWLWGFLKHERRFIKTLQEEGGTIVCKCKVPKGTVRILPNAAEMLHLLNIELLLELK